MNKHRWHTLYRRSTLSLAVALTAGLISACSSDDSNNYATPTSSPVKTYTPITGNDLNTRAHRLLADNPGGPAGATNQSLRATDVLYGTPGDDLIIGGLGADVLVGGEGDDILIGGTEDFNASVDGDNRGADNRDRAFGGAGNDTFIWAPGDGSDFFDGGEGIDVVIFGVIGEQKNAAGETAGAPFFAVNAAGTPGSNDFDGIFVDAYHQPTVKVSDSPGFCSLVDRAAHASALEALGIDQIVRFSLRSIANQFDAGARTDDDGLRVSVSLKNTEFLVCTRRDMTSDGALANVEVLDLRSGVPVAASLTDLPAPVQALIR